MGIYEAEVTLEQLTTISFPSFQVHWLVCLLLTTLVVFFYTQRPGLFEREREAVVFAPLLRKGYYLKRFPRIVHVILGA